jgi:preprotein translocase subunit SecD
MVLNRYPLWKNLCLGFILLLGLIYAAPNLYGDDYAVQVSQSHHLQISEATAQLLETTLKQASIPYISMIPTERDFLIRFPNPDAQLKAKDLLKQLLGDQYTVALNLAPKTPHWLIALNAAPMRLGLDLRGGVNFLLSVDVDSVVTQRLEGEVRNLEIAFHEAKVRYADLSYQKNGAILMVFRDKDNYERGYQLLNERFHQMLVKKSNHGNSFELTAIFSPGAIDEIRAATVEQTMTTLRNRVNELGVAEAVVQQQGSDRISVELPGIQDTARAEEILGGTATLEFRLADQTHDVRQVVAGFGAAGSQVYMYENRPVLLKNQVILGGSSITDASTGFGEDGMPSVNIRLGGGGESLFHRVTGENIGKLMAIVFVETKTTTQNVNGAPQKITKKSSHVISIATIQSALPNSFQITHMTDVEEAKNLALLLRAGALPAPIEIIENRTIGPQLGEENIHRGILSVEIGLLLVVAFMALYYRVFGLIANLALIFNLVLLIALLSILGATLTLPGIAGIVLTVGMAVDANVLIFERIREELRNKTPIQLSIHTGYERAFATILDANITTLIVAVVLFSIGTGPVKGFAITLSLGLLTSMLTGIVFTRAIVNALFGSRRSLKSLPIGI